MDSAIRLRARSTDRTLTRTLSPTVTTSPGSLTKRHPRNDAIAFGVDGARIERLGPIQHTQKARALFKRLVAEPRHLFDGGPRLEWSLARSVRHDSLGERGSKAGHVAQQRRRRRVQVHANPIHGTFHDIVERRRERRLVDVVLVLTDPDALGVDLDQLRQSLAARPITLPTTPALRPRLRATSRWLFFRTNFCRKTSRIVRMDSLPVAIRPPRFGKPTAGPSSVVARGPPLPRSG